VKEGLAGNRFSKEANAMSGFVIREATLDDLDALVRHRHMMFEDMEPRTEEEHAIGDATYRRWAKKMMKDGRLVFFLAEDVKGRVVAGGGVWLHERQPRLSEKAGLTPYLLSMYTDPEFRGRGLGTTIVRSAEDWSRERGYPKITLHASKMGRKLYAKLGWKRGWEMYKELDAPGSDKGKKRASNRRGQAGTPLLNKAKFRT
jgi:GNAT superfamily N-acetyltransferase